MADTDVSADLYRYDADTGDLVRVSTGNDTAPTAAGEEGNTAGMAASITPIAASNQTLGGVGGAHANVNDVGRSISDDGSTVIFATAETLQADDVNGSAPSTCLASAGLATTSPGCDVYEWHDGTVSLISDGHSAEGANNSRAAGTGIPALGMSGDGSAIFFATRTQLVGQDIDAQSDVYVARVDGGMPFVAPSPCSGDACQGSVAPSPFVAEPNTSTVLPSGSPPAAAPTFSVRAVTAAERKALAGRGKLTMSVMSSDAGALTAKATATVAKHSQTVASATKTVGAGQTVQLVLSLSKAARTELSRTGRLTVKVAVSHSAVAVAQTATLKLTHTKAKKKAKATVCKTKTQKRSKACMKQAAKKRPSSSGRGARR
jgi:hypothetical protein